ncbi:MerR family transcriptional regulator [Paenibacillus aestuarii]|uniref:MerR family transcriptional regulator n=1 Tax=Paenibacillus aestuarii TaxID=516965 RepID=A0ABW0K473_9BACL|nr:MerR family transcriptional regulator [Paenibacillus aestuarii]
MKPTLLTIKKMADTTGTSAHTLRYYEKAGLLASIARSSNGYRLYSEADVAWIEFLQRLKATGMSIQQMQQFAALRYKGDETITQRRVLLEEHAQIVQKQISEWSRNLSALEDKIDHYKQLEGEKRNG